MALNPNNATRVRYGKMEFPRYRYQEYPKIVETADGTRKTVQSKPEEIKLLTEHGGAAANTLANQGAQDQEYIRLMNEQQMMLKAQAEHADRQQAQLEKMAKEMEELRRANAQLEAQSAAQATPKSATPTKSPPAALPPATGPAHIP